VQIAVNVDEQSKIISANWANGGELWRRRTKIGGGLRSGWSSSSNVLDHVTPLITIS